MVHRPDLLLVPPVLFADGPAVGMDRLQLHRRRHAVRRGDRMDRAGRVYSTQLPPLQGGTEGGRNFYPSFAPTHPGGRQDDLLRPRPPLTKGRENCECERRAQWLRSSSSILSFARRMTPGMFPMDWRSWPAWRIGR